MLDVDREEEPAELFVALKEGPQGALLGHEVGLLEVFGAQVVGLQGVLADHEAGLLEVFAGPREAASLVLRGATRSAPMIATATSPVSAPPTQARLRRGRRSRPRP